MVFVLASSSNTYFASAYIEFCRIKFISHTLAQYVGHFSFYTHLFTELRTIMRMTYEVIASDGTDIAKIHRANDAKYPCATVTSIIQNETTNMHISPTFTLKYEI